MEKMKMIGEFPVHGESSAAFAISRLLRHLKKTSQAFEEAFQAFQLSVKEWSVVEIDYSPECFYMTVEAQVAVPKGQCIEHIHSFIQKNEYNLYQSENGFLPIELVTM